MDNVAENDKLNRVNTAYEIARSGGRHANWYKAQLGLGKNQLSSGIRSIEKQIMLHKGWIDHPETKVLDWKYRSEQYKSGLINKWMQDIARQQEQIDILFGVMTEKGFVYD